MLSGPPIQWSQEADFDYPTGMSSMDEEDAPFSILGGSSPAVESLDQDLLVREDISKDLHAMMVSERITALAASSRLIAIGTDSGKLYLFSVQGHLIRCLPSHLSHVTDIVILEDDSFIASAALDGSVVVIDTWEVEQANSNSRTLIFSNESVLSVSLCHSYGKDRPRIAFVTQNQGVLVQSTNIFGRQTHRILYSSSQRPPNIVRWSPKSELEPKAPGFLAWSTISSVFLYDYSQKKILLAMDRGGFSGTGRRRSRKSRGNRESIDEEDFSDIANLNGIIEWETSNRVVVGWDDMVQVIDIIQLQDEEHSTLEDSTVAHRVQISASFQVKDHWILGVQPVSNYFVILGWPKTNSGLKVASSETRLPCAEILVVNPSGNIVSRMCLPELMRSADCPLSSFRFTRSGGSDSLFYAMHSYTISLIKLEDVNTLLDRLVEQRRFKEAVQKATNHKDSLVRHSLEDLVSSYIEQLLDDDDNAVTASEVCRRYGKKDKARWTRFVQIFRHRRRVDSIAEYIPFDKPRLSRSLYNKVLNELLETNHEVLVFVVRKWPRDIFDAKSLVQKIESLQKQNFSGLLTEALTKLYIREGKFSQAFDAYTSLRQTYLESTSIADKILPRDQ